MSSLSNLLAIDDQKSNIRILDKNDKNNYNTIPGKNSHSTQLNNSNRLPIIDANFKSQNFYSLFIEISNNKDVEQKWSTHISQLKENSKSMLDTFFIFKCLFKKTKQELIFLSLEYIDTLSIGSKRLNDLEKNFLNISSLLENKLDIPYLYFDKESIMNKINLLSEFNIIQEHLKLALELNEGYKTFCLFKKEFSEVY